MTTLRSFAAFPVIASALIAQTPDFRNAIWGTDRAQVVAAEGAPPSKTGESGSETVLRYESASFAGLECRVVYIFAKDKLVRTKYVFQREHEQKNDYLADFAIVDAFLTVSLERPTAQSLLWHNQAYKTDPQHYGMAVAQGQLLYSTQWNGKRTVVTHALTGENGAITHEIEYTSVDLESWENQVTKKQEGPSSASKTLQSVAAPPN